MGFRRSVSLVALSLVATVVIAACASTGSEHGDVSASDDQEDQTVAVAGSNDAEDSSSDDAATGDSSDETVDEDDQRVDVGVVLSLSGPNATYGTPSQRGIELALESLANDGRSDDVTFSVSVLDDEGDADTGVKRFREHIESGVDVIMGPTLSNTAFEAHPVAQSTGVPVLAISNTAAGITETGEYIFRVSLAEETVVPQTVNVVTQAWQPETAALIFSEDDAWSRSSAEAFRDAASGYDVEIITEQDIPSEGGDLSEQIDAVSVADPDVIFLSALEYASITFVSQAREQGLEQNIACGNGCNTGTFIDETGDASDGLVVGSAWHIDLDTEQSRTFAEQYQERHEIDPDQFSAQAYAGMQILAAAISNAEDLESESLRDALAALGEVESVLGPFSFDENREGSHPAVIKIVRGGEFSIYGK